MEMKRNNICTKLIVAALVLSMGIGAGVPVYAAETSSETVAAEQQERQELTVAEKAAAYFANFPADKHVVSAANLLERVAAGEDICVLDIRSAEDYAAGHIQGAINVPYGVAVAESLDKIPDDIPVLVYCYSGQTASQTIALLNLAGKDAYNVSGGFNNGISKEEAAAGLMTTEETTFGEETYAVDADIQTAIEDYYKQTANETYGKNNISAAQLAELMENSADEICVVDLRSAEDYAAGHIEGAINLPYGKGMQENFSILPTNKTLILQCYSGQTASQTMAGLRVMGYTAYNLSGGMGAEGGSGWLGAGYELVK